MCCSCVRCWSRKKTTFHFSSVARISATSRGRAARGGRRRGSRRRCGRRADGRRAVGGGARSVGHAVLRSVELMRGWSETGAPARATAVSMRLARKAARGVVTRRGAVLEQQLTVGEGMRQMAGDRAPSAPRQRSGTPPRRASAVARGDDGDASGPWLRRRGRRARCPRRRRRGCRTADTSSAARPRRASRPAGKGRPRPGRAARATSARSSSASMASRRSLIGTMRCSKTASTSCLVPKW